jgi:hypothetical protein
VRLTRRDVEVVVLDEVRADIRAVSRPVRILFAVVLALFALIAVARALPVNNNIADNDRAEKPFFEVTERFLFHGRSPALFMGVAEMFVRAGAKTPLPIQLFCVSLVMLGLGFLFLWVRATLDSDWAALAACVFITTRPYFIFVSAVIHHDPYSFLFFHASLYAFTHYLRGGREKWLLATCVAYFLGCQNYWMEYVSTFLMFNALLLKFGRWKWRTPALLGSAAAASVVVTLTFAAIHKGLGQGIHDIADIAVARSGDWRLENSTWYPKQKFIKEDDLASYHLIVAERIKTATGIWAPWLLGLIAAPPIIGWWRGWRHHVWLIPTVFAGLSWHLMMVQHNVIHKFTGAYSGFLWAVLLAVTIRELDLRFTTPNVRRWFVYAAVPIGLAAYVHPYATELSVYLQNIAAGEVVAGETKKGRASRTKRLKAAEEAEKKRAAKAKAKANESREGVEQEDDTPTREEQAE